MILNASVETFIARWLNKMSEKYDGQWSYSYKTPNLHITRLRIPEGHHSDTLYIPWPFYPPVHAEQLANAVRKTEIALTTPEEREEVVPPEPMYKTHQASYTSAFDHQYVEELNRVCAEGWELVAVEGRAWFLRRITEPQA